MRNPTSLLADALGRNLAKTYRRIYGDQEPRMAHALGEAARLVIERIANSDALYHDCEHTVLVTLCVQDILRGRRLDAAVAFFAPLRARARGRERARAVSRGRAYRQPVRAPRRAAVGIDATSSTAPA